MLSGLFETRYNELSFEDIQFAIKNSENFLLINTLEVENQKCLISTTMNINNEERIMNELLSEYNVNSKKIIIYGKNSCDKSIRVKYKQLLKLGFQHLYLYEGGMFEWLCLQDIYGKEEFPTTSKELDLLKYKVKKTFGNYLLT
jgi:hypothetical protein|tara:strand:- start:81 stop:512 length:432 start_codon:yes stop_codon:yes gene_type:complete